ncbi:MAG: 4Fe-4S binding protein [Planctomycetota bacterium]
MVVKIDADKCTGCGLCVDACPQEAIAVKDVAEVDADKCVDCGVCIDECPQEAITE